MAIAAADGSVRPPHLQRAHRGAPADARRATGTPSPRSGTWPPHRADPVATYVWCSAHHPSCSYGTSTGSRTALVLASGAPGEFELRRADGPVRADDALRLADGAEPRGVPRRALRLRDLLVEPRLNEHVPIWSRLPLLSGRLTAGPFGSAADFAEWSRAADGLRGGRQPAWSTPRGERGRPAGGGRRGHRRRPAPRPPLLEHYLEQSALAHYSGGFPLPRSGTTRVPRWHLLDHLPSSTRSRSPRGPTRCAGPRRRPPRQPRYLCDRWRRSPPRRGPTPTAPHLWPAQPARPGVGGAVPFRPTVLPLSGRRDSPVGATHVRCSTRRRRQFPAPRPR